MKVEDEDHDSPDPIETDSRDHMLNLCDDDDLFDEIQEEDVCQE